MFRGHVACHFFHLHRVPAPCFTRPNGLRRRFHGLLVPTRTASDGQRGVESKLVHPGNLIFDSPAIAPKKDISLFVKVCECSPFFLAVVAGLLLVLSFCFLLLMRVTAKNINHFHTRGWFILRVAG